MTGERRFQAGPTVGPDRAHDQGSSAIVPIEICWRMLTASGRVFECAIYRRHTWFDVRLVADGHILVYSQLATSLDRARHVATLWRERFQTGGAFIEIDEGP